MAIIMALHKIVLDCIHYDENFNYTSFHIIERFLLKEKQNPRIYIIYIYI